MKKILLGIFILAVMTGTSLGHEKANSNPRVVLETTKGEIVLELYADKAPLSVKNFLDYMEAGFYSNIIFHRVIPGFMIHGGGFSRDMQKKPTQTPIKNEAHNGLKNDRGTIAMARTQAPHSASSHFYGGQCLFELQEPNHVRMGICGIWKSGQGYGGGGCHIQGNDRYSGAIP